MKTDRVSGLVGAGGVTRSFLARMPKSLATLGPIKAASFRVARRLSNTLRAGYAVSDYAALQPCTLIWLAVPDPMLDRVVRDLCARTPLKGTDALTRMGSVGGGRHFTANLTVTPTPDGARGSCYLLLFDARHVPATLTETAIYDDTLVRTPQGWRFKKRVVWRDDDDISPFKPKPRP